MNFSAADKEPKFADVSVVMPCFRCCSTLSRAIESVIRQTLLPRELILVDDCSGDETSDLLQAWHLKHPEWIRVLSLSANSGPGVARNAGWGLAQGKYVALLDADDSWHPEKLAIQYTYMLNHPEVELTGHGHAVNQMPTFFDFHPARDCIRLAPWRLLLKNPFVTPSVMLKTALATRFSPSRRYMEDHLLWMELALAGHRIEKLKLPLTILHKAQLGASGLSNHIRAMSKADFENYIILYRKGLIGWGFLVILLAWAAIKFLRRSFFYGVPRVFKRWLLPVKWQH